ncbi:MAG: YwmB family TATA-box binding protein [Lachnospiraceae bacterium]|nr:YwmB family TATA-box binding protein [Lachnospiraceae bacterium]
MKNEVGLGAFFVTKKVKISFLIVVWSIVAIQMFVNYQEKMKHDNQAVTAFSVIEDVAFSERISGYGYFGTMDITDEIKKEMLENLAYKLGITEGYAFGLENNDDYMKLELKGNGVSGDAALQLISIIKPGSEPEQYIIMDIRTKTDLQNAQALFQKVKRVYEEIGVEAQTSLEIEAEQKGEIINENDIGIVENILKSTDAKKVDVIRENGIYTIYGYTRKEESFVKLNNKKVNLQIVMTYDETQDKTYLKIGVPIVNTSY